MVSWARLGIAGMAIVVLGGCAAGGSPMVLGDARPVAARADDRLPAMSMATTTSATTVPASSVPPGTTSPSGPAPSTTVPGRPASSSVGSVPRSTVAESLAAPSGTTFVDPQGSYEMTIDPGWSSRTGSVAPDVELWVVGPLRDGFTPAVAIVSQPSDGLGLEEYVALNVRELPQLGFEVLSTGVVVGAAGNRVAVVEYVGVPPNSPSGRRLRFLAVASVRGTNAVVATFADGEGGFPSSSKRVEPFLRSLRAL
ncbi:MAG: hypothetical protein ACKO91_14920 [Acidimicrobiales bacterium]